MSDTRADFEALEYSADELEATELDGPSPDVRCDAELDAASPPGCPSMVGSMGAPGSCQVLHLARRCNNQVFAAIF